MEGTASNNPLYSPHRENLTGPDPSKYYDARTQQLNDGTPLASVVPGARGTVIPMATSGGVPSGYDATKPLVVNIDPHLPSGGFTVDLANITKEDTVAVTNGGKSITNALGHEAARNASAAAFAALARGDGRKQASAAPVAHEPSTTVDLPPQPAQMVYAPPMPPPSPVPYSPPTVMHNPVSRLRPPVQPRIMNTNPDTVSPPEVMVAFDVEGMGEMEAAYHKVIKGDDDVSLVLVYDRRYKGGFRYKPAVTDSVMYIDVQGFDEVYRVCSAGLHFTIDNLDCCVLLIQETAQKETRRVVNYG